MMMQSLFIGLAIFGPLAIALPRDPRWRQCLAVMLLTIPCILLVRVVLSQMALRPSFRYDEWFYLADRWLGSPSWVLARMVRQFPHLWLVAEYDYSLTLEIASASVMILVILRRDPWKAFGTLVSSAAIAQPSYKLFPASGPLYAFSGFPDHLPTITVPHVIYLSAPPNCMPSMHMACALMVLHFLRHWRAGRVAGGIHVALTALSTLASGEHYLIDLIASVPCAYAFIWLWERKEIKAAQATVLRAITRSPSYIPPLEEKA